ncbi:MAG: serine hydrolase [Elusimicrobia bacterium]|nr:serine hydrolase [Elusimicrobiota bacterium]
MIAIVFTWLAVAAAFAAVLVVAAEVAGRLWRTLGVGSAYKAKILCSAIFVSGRDIDPDRADEVSAEAYRTLRFFRARVDRERKRVTASCLGLRPRSAVFRPGLGATLEFGQTLPPGPACAPLAAPTRGLAADPALPWPQGEGSGAPAPPALARVIEDAFREPDPDMPRRTRAIVVVHDGRLIAERYGEGISACMPLPGWSMAKSALGALVGCAVREGRLRLDRTRLLPEWSSDSDPRSAICLEDLLRMRSGLAWTEAYDDTAADVVRMLFARPDAAAFAAAKPLLSPIGSVWQYSSGTANILSRVLRGAVGDEEYPGYPRRALFEPVGMRTAVLEPDASGTFLASSFMHASARDWARFGLLFLQDGVWQGRRLLPEGWVTLSTTPTPQAPGGRFGAHWWLKCPEELGGGTEAGLRLPPDAFYALGHEGQTLTVIPSRRLVVVRLGLSIRIDAWNHAQFLDGLLSAL